jgi:hypothetical protein
LTSKVALPNTVLLVVSVKTTVPLGVPALEVTVAVKVTACPKTEGLGWERLIVVVVAVGGGGLTVCCTVLEVLVR